MKAEQLLKGRPIVHNGVATAVDGMTASVRVDRRSACDECRARLLCAGSHGRSCTITAECREALAPGDRVRLELAPSVGWFAVAVAFLLPFLLLVTTFFTVLTGGWGELAAGLAALGVLPPYYLLVYTQRSRMAQFVRIGAYRMTPGRSEVRYE